MNAMKASDSLRNFVESIAKLSTWALAPLVLITMWDVVARKFVFIQIYMVANFGRMFESTLLQEMEWHLHTVVFTLVLGYGYIHNRHVRVDFLREHFHFRTKTSIEFWGNIIFMLPFTLTCVYFSIIYMVDSFIINEVSASLVGLSHRWIIKCFLPAGYFLLFLAGMSVMLQLYAVLYQGVTKQSSKSKLMVVEWPEDSIGLRGSKYDR